MLFLITVIAFQRRLRPETEWAFQGFLKHNYGSGVGGGPRKGERGRVESRGEEGGEKEVSTALASWKRLNNCPNCTQPVGKKPP